MGNKESKRIPFSGCSPEGVMGPAEAGFAALAQGCSHVPSALSGETLLGFYQGQPFVLLCLR